LTVYDKNQETRQIEQARWNRHENEPLLTAGRS